MNKDAAYQELVSRRKAHIFPSGLLNPSQIEGGRYDSAHLGPWSRWQGALDAEVVVVGQDWGDSRYFLKNQGIDCDGEVTCTNLRRLGGAAGLDIGTPHAPVPQKLFFTNAILGIRAVHGKSGGTPGAWVDDSLPYLGSLLEIVQPRLVISLGVYATRACRTVLGGRGRNPLLPLGAALGRIHAQNPLLHPGKPALIALYHCSGLGLANRSMDLQMEDWQKAGRWLRSAL